MARLLVKPSSVWRQAYAIISWRTSIAVSAHAWLVRAIAATPATAIDSRDGAFGEAVGAGRATS